MSIFILKSHQELMNSDHVVWLRPQRRLPDSGIDNYYDHTDDDDVTNIVMFFKILQLLIFQLKLI